MRFLNGSFVVAYTENVCALSYTGMGTELDWLRALWDVHTNGSTPPGFTEIVEWIDAADTWSSTGAYTELDQEANTVGGSLNTNWSLNGIDW